MADHRITGNNKTTKDHSRFKCTLCNKELSSLSLLIRHKRTHAAGYKGSSLSLPPPPPIPLKPRTGKDYDTGSFTPVGFQSVSQFRRKCPICRETFSSLVHFDRHRHHAGLMLSVVDAEVSSEMSSAVAASENTTADNFRQLPVQKSTQTPEKEYKSSRSDENALESDAAGYRGSSISNVASPPPIALKAGTGRDDGPDTCPLDKRQSIGQRHHKCSVCYKHFSSPELLVRHIRSTRNCRFFDGGLKTSIGEVKVLELSFKTGSTIAPTENKTADDNLGELSYKGLTKRPENLRKCSTCDKSFPRLSSLIQHHKKYHSMDTLAPEAEKTNQQEVTPTSDNIRCDYCWVPFNSDVDRWEHQEGHTGTGSRKYACLFCNKCFTSWNQLREHVAVVHEVEDGLPHPQPFIFKCGGVCQQIFPTQFDLKHHQLRENHKPQFCCGICGEYFRTADRRRSHELSHQEDPTKKTKQVNCKICGRRYGSKESLQNHIVKYKTLCKRFNCRICLVGFPSQIDLDKHGIQHGKIRHSSKKSRKRRKQSDKILIPDIGPE